MKFVPLTELAREITVGYVGPMAQEYIENGIPFLRSQNVKPFKFDPDQIKFISEEFDKRIKKSRLSPGDVIVVRTGNPGVACVVPTTLPEANCSDLVIVRCREEIDPHYICYYINSVTHSHVSGQLVGAIQKHFNVGSAKELLVPDITPYQRKQTAAILRSLDEKIELNNRINEELESLAKLIYDYWFVQFDFPITAAQADAMGDPTLEGKPYKSSGGPMTHNHQLNREIPEGWTANTPSSKALLNELEWNDRTAPNKVTYLDLSNAKGGKILGTNNYSWETAPSRAKRILRDGDTVIGTVRPGNRSYCLIGPSETQLTGSTGFAVFSPIDSIFREFTYLTLTSAHNIKRLATVASGASYPAVNSNVVGSHPMAFPSDELIEGFHRKTAPMFDLLLTNQKQNQELAALRDWLLPMLMNGQVTVQS
ncbi:hypothetical protein [Roseibacillus persicicus]|uniref:Restriction endonuclease subunit S n=1 Tax=Roseibacillus persicicus TaxID=454148 RepID=A0A918TT11_9BACT|nr:hypothetical protein [Roseibacillus persicicus]GHC59876.1 hypothetical protein GCM10007100_28930 [Roseibacillus persicicus]